VQSIEINSENKKQVDTDGQTGVGRTASRMRPEVSIWSDAIERMKTAIRPPNSRGSRIDEENRCKIATNPETISRDPDADPLTPALGIRCVWEGEKRAERRRELERWRVGGVVEVRGREPETGLRMI
jgi:hypothetical protein